MNEPVPSPTYEPRELVVQTHLLDDPSALLSLTIWSALAILTLGGIAYVVVEAFRTREWSQLYVILAIVPWVFLFGVPLSSEFRSFWRDGGVFFTIKFGPKGTLALSRGGLNRFFFRPQLREFRRTVMLSSTGYANLNVTFRKSEISESDLVWLREAVERHSTDEFLKGFSPVTVGLRLENLKREAKRRQH